MTQEKQDKPEPTMTPQQFARFGENMGHAWENYTRGVTQVVTQGVTQMYKTLEDALEKTLRDLKRIWRR